MRSIISSVVVVSGTLAAMSFGCASDKSAKSSAHVEAPAANVAGTKSCVMQFGGRDVLLLTAPADTNCAASDGAIKMESHGRRVEIWLVRGAQSVDEATGRLAQQITDEFKDFKATSTTDLTVADSPAKRMVGTGTEADDGDAGDADVIVFKAGEHVFVACTHGEGLSAADKQWMVAVVQTARKP